MSTSCSRCESVVVRAVSAGALLVPREAWNSAGAVAHPDRTSEATSSASLIDRSCDGEHMPLQRSIQYDARGARFRCLRNRSCRRQATLWRRRAKLRSLSEGHREAIAHNTSALTREAQHHRALSDSNGLPGYSVDYRRAFNDLGVDSRSSRRDLDGLHATNACPDGAERRACARGLGVQLHPKDRS